MPERIEITKMKQNWNNREYVIENVKQEGALLEFASEELRDDKEVDVKHVPKRCISPELQEMGEKYYQYTVIDEFTRIRYIGYIN